MVGFNDKNYFKSHFIKHQKTCPAFLQVAATKMSRKRSAEALEEDCCTVLNREELDMPPNNLSEKFSLSNTSPLSTMRSYNIVGEVSLIS